MDHNFQRLKFSASLATVSAPNEEKKIDWALHALKKNKTAHEELMSWFSTEREWTDLKTLVAILEHPEHAVLNIKSEKEGLKMLSLFLIKEIGDVPVDVDVSPEVRQILSALPDVVPEVTAE